MPAVSPCFQSLIQVRLTWYRFSPLTRFLKNHIAQKVYFMWAHLKVRSPPPRHKVAGEWSVRLYFRLWGTASSPCHVLSFCFKKSFNSVDVSYHLFLFLHSFYCLPVAGTCKSIIVIFQWQKMIIVRKKVSTHYYFLTLSLVLHDGLHVYLCSIYVFICFTNSFLFQNLLLKCCIALSLVFSVKGVFLLCTVDAFLSNSTFLFS